MYSKVVHGKTPLGLCKQAQGKVKHPPMTMAVNCELLNDSTVMACIGTWLRQTLRFAEAYEWVACDKHKMDKVKHQQVIMAESCELLNDSTFVVHV